MNDIEAKALALVREVLAERNLSDKRAVRREVSPYTEALCRAIEAHEAFKQKVSFAVQDVMERDLPVAVLRRFVIEDKPDALVDVWGDLFIKNYNLDQFCDALEARGLEIREKDE
jgi:hypothetical protein